ncbi:retrovirus-related pol polyprotein from transposon TNT 1-94 [Tanacetum coccineum]
MARQCTQPKRPRNSAWFKEKLMLVEAQEAGQILDEEQLAFIADPRIEEAPVAQQTIPQNLAFQTKDLDAYDSDCDDISLAKAVQMENLSSCDSDVISEVPYSDAYLNDMIDQDIKPTLYDGSVIAKEHDVISKIDDEETLILEEASRSKMLDKQNDPISIKQKINISLIDYSKLNKIKEDFGLRFVTKKELSAEQAFWLKHLNHTFDTYVKSHTPVRIEAPSELPKVSLVNESLKKLKYHLVSFDKVVKKKTTSDAITAAVVDQCSVDKNDLEIQIKQLSIDNDQLLNQIMSQEIMHIAVNSVDLLNVNKSCVDECNKCLELETELLKKKDLIEKDVYDKLVKSYLTLEKHCISLELATQLNQEIFQKENSGESQNAPTFNQLVEINELKARSQEKDMVIRKLKDRIKSLSGKDSKKNVKKEIDEIETINIELEHTLKNELRKNKGKNVVGTAVSTPTATTIALEMFKLDVKSISHRLKNNRDAHVGYLKKTIENTDTICGLVERARKQNPIAVTLMNKDKKARFLEPVTSSSNIPKQTDSLKTKDSNKPLLTFTGVNTTTSASRSKPSGNTKKNRITRSQVAIRRINWKPTGRIFTIVGNRCPLTRITSTTEVPLKETTITLVITPSLELKKHSHKTKAEESIQEKLYLLHMDLCGPMMIQSIDGRKYILFIVDDYSRFTWVKFLRSKDEVPEFMIKFLKTIQVRLNATVCNIRTDNGTAFVNQTLRAYYEEVRISHQTSVARTPQ